MSADADGRQNRALIIRKIVRPKEQPPRKLSGKKDRNILTLERDLVLAEGAKLSGKHTDGLKS
tara:strand:+ start:91 stop:279 length:189 start_codon:yes stop_codon:yes gene_type:complete